MLPSISSKIADSYSGHRINTDTTILASSPGLQLLFPTDRDLHLVDGARRRALDIDGGLAVS
jgi:hypothetical protein